MSENTNGLNDYSGEQAFNDVTEFFNRGTLPPAAELSKDIDYYSLKSINFFKGISKEGVEKIREQIGEALDLYIWWNAELVELSCTKRLLLCEINDIEKRKRNYQQSLLKLSNPVIEGFVKREIQTLIDDTKVIRRALVLVDFDIENTNLGDFFYNCCDPENMEELEMESRVLSGISKLGVELAKIINTEFSEEILKNM